MFGRSKTCMFCSLTFNTNSEKNIHILDHFEQEFCLKCDQNLLRIGDNLYVLHGTITCIGTKLKHESIDDEMNDIAYSPVHHEQVDVKQWEPQYTEQTDEDFDNLPEIDALNSSDIKYEQNEDQGLPEIESVAIENMVEPLSQLQHDSNSNQIKITCDNCGSKNLSKLSFKRHHEIPGFKCSECDVTCCKVSLLKVHYRKHHPSADPYQGIDIRHKTTIHDSKSSKKYKCAYENCDEMFSLASRRFHIDSKHNGQPYRCDICQKPFTLLGSARRHMEVHDANRKRFKCNTCGATNLTEQFFKRYHETPGFKCSECGDAFCKVGQLKEHYHKYHPDVDPYQGFDIGHRSTIRYMYDSKSIKKFKCTFDGCDEMLSIGSRRSHIEHKHKGKTYECDICKKMFSTKDTIRYHILRVHAPLTLRKFKCDLCIKSYITESELRKHYNQTHHKGGHLMCSECGSTFLNNSQLMVHITKHTGEKPYPCTFDGCSKRFRTKTGRTEHLRSHTGEKPYKCPVDECDRCFSYAVDLRRHKFNAHKIYSAKHPCQICSEIFPEGFLLKKHMKKHNIHTQSKS